MSTFFDFLAGNQLDILLLLLAFVGYAFTKMTSDKMLWYPERYADNKWWKHAKVDEQMFKPLSNYLAFLKDGYHFLELLKASWFFVAAGIFNLGIALTVAFISFIVQKVWMK